VKCAAVKTAGTEPTAAKHAAASVKSTTATVKARATSAAACRVCHRWLEGYRSKQQSSDARESPRDLPPGSITPSLRHRALLSKGCAAGS